MYRLGYWLTVVLLALLTFIAFRYAAMEGMTLRGIGAGLASLVFFALLLSFGYSMRDRDRRSHPIDR